MLKVVVLKILAKVAFIAIKNKQLVYPYYTRLYMRVKVL